MGKHRITNNDELTRLLTAAIDEAIVYTVEQIWKHNQTIIDRVVYRSYSPKEYQRTGEFKDTAWRQSHNTSVRKGVGKVHGRMGYDGTMNANVVPGSFNQHMGFNEQTIKFYLAEIIYQGLVGDFTGQYKYAKDNPAFANEPWAQPRDAWAELTQWLSVEQMQKIFEKGMRKNGLSFVKRKNINPPKENKG